MNLGNTILRWVLAPIGGAAAFAVCFAVAIWIAFGLTIVAGGSLSDGPPPLAFLLGTMSGLLGWVWAGSVIVPVRHRRIAIAIFSMPIVLLALAALFLSIVGRLRPEYLPIYVGLWLACAGVVILAVHASVLARRKRAEDLADVFSDKPDRQMTPRT